ncbi:uncharacterized protein LOC124283496 [Haliotis rubra]|uniref:uncharacterized protein LOC124283496 n=1 Tax=Haliotis rubra TaxID=36100 RepID=UPI001EE59F9B|nr:uncharacterized protein LOC124283496 [Haliotis rubra]
MEPAEFNFGCKCRSCYSYNAPDDGVNCTTCGCAPSDHTVVMRVSPDEDEDDDVSDTSCDSLVPYSENMSGTTSAPLSDTKSWSLTDPNVTVDFASLLKTTKNKKRALDDLSGEPSKKKPKGTTTGPKQTRLFVGLRVC